MLGFAAVGELALGQPGSLYFSLVTQAGAHAVTGRALSFGGAEIGGAGSHVLTGQSATLADRMASAAGVHALSGVTSSLTLNEPAAAGICGVTGYPATEATGEPSGAGAYAVSGYPVGLPLAEPAAAGAFAVSGVAAGFPIAMVAGGGSYVTIDGNGPVSRTGDNYEFKLGGIGHFLLELEERRRLAAITRATPAPIDVTSAPAFRPVLPPPVPRAPQAPRIDLAAPRAAQEGQAALAMAKRRRQEAEILLLVA